MLTIPLIILTLFIFAKPISAFLKNGLICRIEAHLPSSLVCCDFSTPTLWQLVERLHVCWQIHNPRSCIHCWQPGGTNSALQQPLLHSLTTHCCRGNVWAQTSCLRTYWGAFPVGANEWLQVILDKSVSRIPSVWRRAECCSLFHCCPWTCGRAAARAAPS